MFFIISLNVKQFSSFPNWSQVTGMLFNFFLINNVQMLYYYFVIIPFIDNTRDAPILIDFFSATENLYFVDTKQ